MVYERYPEMYKYYVLEISESSVSPLHEIQSELMCRMKRS
jgi:hypothetical protein